MLSRILGEVYKKQIFVENIGGITQILDDTSGFAEVNGLLTADMEVFKHSVHFLAMLGGIDYKESVKRILQRLLTNSLMKQYSLYGHKGKKIFRNTKIINRSNSES